MGEQSLQVLISGAGIAGAALACLLVRDGHEVTVVERDQGVRSSGNPVDVRGRAFDVVEELGLLVRLQDLATQVRELVFVDTVGQRVASIPTRRSDRELEVPRADLCAALVDSARDVTEFRFDDTVTSLRPDGLGVEVAFERGRPQRFDLVVGADGLHSTVRRLAFGPESAFITHLGLYVATMPWQTGLDNDGVLMHNQPGAAIALHPGSGQPGAAFMFRSSAQVNPRDHDGVTQLMVRIYSGMEWRAPELLDGYSAAGDRYFDAVSRARVPGWARGRVVLIGDAASCVSLFGEGSSSAIAGAATLAQSLFESPGDVGRALLRYQAKHQVVARRGQRGAAIAAHLLIPTTSTGIVLRNQILRRTGHQ